MGQSVAMIPGTSLLSQPPPWQTELAAAIERTGLTGDRAISAINNWLIGRDHPCCKSPDIAKLALQFSLANPDIATNAAD